MSDDEFVEIGKEGSSRKRRRESKASGALRLITAAQFFEMLDDPAFPTWVDRGVNKIVKIDKSGALSPGR